MLRVGPEAPLTILPLDTPVPSRHGSAPLWRRSPSALWRTVLDDAVLAPVNGEDQPFALTGGARLWDLLSEPRSLDELTGALGAEGEPQALEDLLLSLWQAHVVEQVEA